MVIMTYTDWMLRLGRSLGMVLRKEAYTMWMRLLKKVTLCLLMGPLIVSYGCGTDV